MKRLEGLTVVVTGAAGGLGEAFAWAVVREGGRVVLADTDMARLTEVERGIHKGGGAALAVETSVSDRASVDEMVTASIGHFGSLDVLINNAAAMASLQRGPFVDIAEADWDRVMAVNLKGPWLCAAAMASELAKSDNGRIINVASDMALAGAADLLHYSASKGGLIALTKALAREIGSSGVTVNAIAPGFTETEAARRQGEGVSSVRISARAIKREQHPSDIVGAAIYLASPESAMMTGQVLVINGGSYMR